MTVRRAIAFAATVLLPAGPLVGQQDLPSRIEAARQAVVTIYTFQQDGSSLGSGTGFFVDATGRLVTNRHVMEGAFRAEAVLFDGRRLEIDRVLGEDEAADLAIVSTPAAVAVAWLNLATSVPRVGESVLVIGSPLGVFEATASNGIVAALRADEYMGEVIQITAPISPGSSGSPVMNAAGEVIGVATGTVTSGQNLNFAVPASRIIALSTTRPLRLHAWGQRTRRAPIPEPALMSLGQARIRVSAARVGVTGLTGVALGARADTLIFQPDLFPARLYLPASSLRRLEVSRGRRHLGAIGALLGAVSLGYVGGKLGWDNTLGFDCKPDPFGEPDCQFSPGERALQGGVLGGLVGAGVGYVMGAQLRFERWHPIAVGPR